jgi:probable F420-dependent oxidoreductase
MTVRLNIQLDAAPHNAATRARRLSSSGAAGLFTFEGQHDVFLPLALAARETDLDLMTNVAIAPPRSPVHLAHLAHDLHRLSEGRFSLGLGSQVRAHIVNRYGASWIKPAAQMRESVLAVKAILDSWQAGTPLDFRGEFTRHTLMPPSFAPPPNPYGLPPVLMGALGPVMTRTAAEVADGLLVMPFHSERHFQQRTLPAVDEGLRRSGRHRSDFEIVPQVIVAVGRTTEELHAGTQGVRQLLAFYSSTPAYVPVLEVEGWADVQPRLNQMSKVGAYANMAALITEDMVEALAIRGTPEDCAAEVLRRFGAHASRVCAYFPGYDVDLRHVRDLSEALHYAEVPVA